MTLQLITHLIVAAVVGLATWTYQGARMDAAVAQLQHEASKAVAEASERVRTAESRASEKYQEALNNARKREATLRTELDRLKRTSDSLRSQAAEAARRLAEAPPTAVAEYAATTNELFDNCRRAYAGMAKAAAGHAADVATLVESWPVIPNPKGNP